MKTNPYRVAILLAALAGAALLLWPGGEPASPVSPVTDRSLDHRLQRVEAELRVHRSLATNRPASPAPTPRETDDDDDHEPTEEPPAPPELSPAQVMEARATLRDHIDQQIADQGFDRSRSDQLAETIAATIETHVTAAGSVAEVTCSSTLCRVVLAHEGRDDQTDFLAQLQGHEGFRDAGIAHLEADGTTYVYLAPGAEQFPDFEPAVQF